MKPVTPPLPEGYDLTIFAKDQPPYIPLPAAVDGNGTVMTEWELTASELGHLMCGGRIRLWMFYTGVRQGALLTPLKIETVEIEES